MLKSFDTLITLAQNKANSAAIKVGQLISRQSASEQKRAMLANYRDEYRVRLDAAVMRGAPVSEVRNFRAFLEKLDEAVRQQESEVEFWGAQIATASGQWQQEKRSLNSFNTISARREAVVSRTHARREQKLQDEFAARAAGAQRFAFGE